MILAGCGSSAPGSESGSQTDAKAGSENPEANLAAPADKLSSDNPVVVLPKSEDLDRRKELAALLPMADDSDSGSKDDTSPSVITADQPADVDSQNSTEPEAQKKDTAADPESQQPAGSDPVLRPRTQLLSDRPNAGTLRKQQDREPRRGVKRFRGVGQQ